MVYRSNLLARLPSLDLRGLSYHIGPDLNQPKFLVDLLSWSKGFGHYQVVSTIICQIQNHYSLAPNYRGYSKERVDILLRTPNLGVLMNGNGDGFNNQFHWGGGVVDR